MFPPGVKDISADLNPPELAKALKKCCKFFSTLEQDAEEEKVKYMPFCQYIVQDEFIKEVDDAKCKIHLGCIIADIFRLHAPENPFRLTDKLKDILMFITEQLSYLKDPKSQLYIHSYHILENVSTVKSFNICLDMDDVNAATDVLLKLFRTFFSIVNSAHD